MMDIEIHKEQSKSVSFSHNYIQNFLFIWIVFCDLFGCGSTSVVIYGLFWVHNFPFFFYKKKDCLRGSHFRGPFKVLLEA